MADLALTVEAGAGRAVAEGALRHHSHRAALVRLLDPFPRPTHQLLNSHTDYN